WRKAPPLQGMSVVKLRPGSAEALAVHPELKVDGKPAVAVAWQRFGAGQVLVLTFDTTWRWSRLTRLLGQPDTLYARFWSQTIRWLAGRSLEDRRALLTVSTDHIAYDTGKPVKVTVVRHVRPEVDLSSAQ